MNGVTMIRNLFYIVCGLLVVTAAVVHGSSTHRWSMLNPNPARASAAHEHAVTLADYTSKDIPSELPVKERSSVTCRQYTSPSGLPSFLVSITSGPPGAVSTHTPDVCYVGSGYKMLKQPKLETVELPGGKQATYLVADLEKRSNTTVDRQRVRWSWSTGSSWEIPERPRFAFLREPELFKIYIVTVLADEAPEVDSPDVKSFVSVAFAQYIERLSAR
jgi:hypothetical protein